MAEGDDSIYDDLVDKLAFGNFVEVVLSRPTMGSKKKSKMTSVFVDDRSEDLFKYKAATTYKLVANIAKYPNETINNFSALMDFDCSREFIYNNVNLISQSTIDYIKLWLMDLESDNDFTGTYIVSNQLMIIKSINALINPTAPNPSKAIEQFFTQMGDEEYKTQFDKELEELRRLVEDENEECVKRYGPGGLDPKDVIKSLPLALLECFQSGDLAQLVSVLSTMDRQEADLHFKRCVDSGLLVLNTKEAADDGEEETKDGEDDGKEDMEK